MRGSSGKVPGTIFSETSAVRVGGISLASEVCKVWGSPPAGVSAAAPKVFIDISSVKARVRIRIGFWWFGLRGEGIF